jgi:GNAT superfamily N-acetyltransferase
MSLTMRPYQNEDDYWRIRAFLREVFLRNGRLERSWPVLRWDYWRWHINENIFHLSLDEAVWLWETAEGRIGAVLNADHPDEAFLQLHPAYRTEALLEEMVAVAEEGLGRRGKAGSTPFQVWCHESDQALQAVLRGRGYKKGDWPEHQRRRPIGESIPETPLAPGYVVRPLGDVEELPARSAVSWQAFHPGEPDEKYEGWHWYHNVQRIPLYRRDLDIVAVAPDGTFAAFCTAWFDDVTRTGVFEPVGTAPAHQRRGLGKAVMFEALRRLQRLGADLAAVGSYSPAAHALYHSAGFVEFELSEPWSRVL